MENKSTSERKKLVDPPKKVGFIKFFTTWLGPIIYTAFSNNKSIGPVSQKCLRLLRGNSATMVVAFIYSELLKTFNCLTLFFITFFVVTGPVGLCCVKLTSATAFL